MMLAGMALAGSCWAAEDCPLIRPSGLSPSDVDQIVIGRLAEGLEVDPARIDRSKTIKALARKDDGLRSYAYFVVSTGESLGFDSAAAFQESARRKGGKPPFESLTVSDFQAISREAYAKGKEMSPPAVKANAEYALFQILVRVPSPSEGWVVLRCMTDQIVFQRIEAGTGNSTAMARTLGVQAFATSREFVEYTRNQATDALSKVGKIRSLDVSAVPGSALMCAKVKAELETMGLPQRINAGYCYSGKKSQLVYAAMFSHFGSGSVERFTTEADAFIAGALPK
jgi:hypothetical protein